MIKFIKRMLYLFGKKLGKLFLDGKSIGKAYLDGYKVFDSSSEEEVAIRDLKIIGVIPEEGTWSPSISANEHLYYWTCVASSLYIGRIKVRYQYTTRGSEVVTKEGMALVLFSSIYTDYPYLNLTLKALSSLGTDVVTANNNIIEFNIQIWLDNYGNSTDVLPSDASYIGELYKSDDYPNRFVLARLANKIESTEIVDESWRPGFVFRNDNTDYVVTNSPVPVSYAEDTEHLYATALLTNYNFNTYTSGATEKVVRNDGVYSYANITSSESWCTVKLPSGYVYPIYINENSGGNRAATLSFVRDNETKILEIDQSANPNYITYDDLQIVSYSADDVRADGSNSVSEVTVNYSYTNNNATVYESTKVPLSKTVTGSGLGTTITDRTPLWTETVSLVLGDANPAYIEVTIYQEANVKLDSTYEFKYVYISADNIPAGGGSVTSGTCVYAIREWYNYTAGDKLFYNNVDITSGGSVDWSGGTENVPSRGIVIGDEQEVGTLYATVTYNGTTSEKASYVIKQNANVVVDSYYDEPVITELNDAEISSSYTYTYRFSLKLTQTWYKKYTSYYEGDETGGLFQLTQSNLSLHSTDIDANYNITYSGDSGWITDRGNGYFEISANTGAARTATITIDSFSYNGVSSTESYSMELTQKEVAPTTELYVVNCTVYNPATGSVESDSEGVWEAGIDLPYLARILLIQLGIRERRYNGEYNIITTTLDASTSGVSLSNGASWMSAIYTGTRFDIAVQTNSNNSGRSLNIWITAIYNGTTYSTYDTYGSTTITQAANPNTGGGEGGGDDTEDSEPRVVAVSPAPNVVGYYLAAATGSYDVTLTVKKENGSYETIVSAKRVNVYIDTRNIVDSETEFTSSSTAIGPFCNAGAVVYPSNGNPVTMSGYTIEDFEADIIDLSKL